ncbi:TetR/AcrR family transcriptional regulator [Pseudoduganella sp. RAF53_2]|uniref:TetR/AcrR family transcriptional regulator n=1 Tax=unclassified Pseudoduganella TaxID=2637179 RepID=UPI003F9D55D3
MNTEDIPNHRTRVGAKRREKTRAKLLESALLVFAQKGPQAVIEDVIAQAGIARGSFYNYFRTNDELLEAVASEINDDLLRAIDPVVQQCSDPAERIACGARLVLRTARRFPLFGHFLAGLPFPAANSSLLGVQYLSRDVALGVATRRFGDIDQRMGIDLLVGVVVSAACSMAREQLGGDYADASARAMLRALGMEDQEAARIAALPLPAFELPEHSILRRTQLFKG